MPVRRGPPGLKPFEQTSGTVKTINTAVSPSNGEAYSDRVILHAQEAKSIPRSLITNAKKWLKVITFFSVSDIFSLPILNFDILSCVWFADSLVA